MPVRLFFYSLGLCFLPLFAGAQDAPFSTQAPHAVIMDYQTGLVLYEKEARDPIAPASMTKIMTAELVFEKIKSGEISLDTEFMVSQEAWRRGGAKSGSSTMFLKPGSRVRVEDLLRGVIIQSGNDACIVLAEGLAGSEAAFAEEMTRRAREMGLSSATFKNTTGWPHDEHKISLYDLAKLSRETISKYPEFYALYAEREYRWNGITQANRNPLLDRFSGADGLKTGHTNASGYGLVASAVRGDARRIIVFNGLKSKLQRKEVGLALMQAAFERFVTKDLYAASETVASVDVFMGKAPSVNVAPDAPIAIGLEREQQGALEVFMRSKEQVAAPVAKGEHIADLIVRLPGQDDQVFPLKATQDVKQKSAPGRAWTAFMAKVRG